MLALGALAVMQPSWRSTLMGHKIIETSSFLIERKCTMSILSHSEDSNKTTGTAAVTATGTATATATTADKYCHGGQVDDKPR